MVWLMTLTNVVPSGVKVAGFVLLLVLSESRVLLLTTALDKHGGFLADLHWVCSTSSTSRLMIMLRAYVQTSAISARSSPRKQSKERATYPFESASTQVYVAPGAAWSAVRLDATHCWRSRHADPFRRETGLVRNLI